MQEITQMDYHLYVIEEIIGLCSSDKLRKKEKVIEHPEDNIVCI